MASFDSQKHQLAGSLRNEAGGLQVKKTPRDFKKPAVRESVLGLDALARQKRREQEEERKRKAEERRRTSEQTPVAKRHKDNSGLNSARDGNSSVGGGNVLVSFGSSGHARDRVYRYDILAPILVCFCIIMYQLYTYMIMYMYKY